MHDGADGEDKPQADGTAPGQAPAVADAPGGPVPECGTQPHGDQAQESPDPAALLAQLEEQQRLAGENWEKYLRAQAEQDNIRKRAEREIDNARRYALERLAQDLLGALDSLELGIKAAAQTGTPDAQQDGMKLTLRLMQEAFARHGIEEIDPVGQSFDPGSHEAMSTAPTSEAAPNTVLEVMQKGYRLGDRLLRPAMVIVAAAPADAG